jgi:hypothetical protein
MSRSLTSRRARMLFVAVLVSPLTGCLDDLPTPPDPDVTGVPCVATSTQPCPARSASAHGPPR